MLALKAYSKVDVSDDKANDGSLFGDAAIQLLRDMRSVDRINEKSQRIPKAIELIEERDRLLDCIDEQKRQQVLSEYSDSCA